MRKIKHVFFDLDHTLWDFDKNAEETLHELYHTYRLKELGLHSADLFIETYTQNNHRLWAEYHSGLITRQQLRETRFSKTFLDLGLSPEVIPLQFEDEYVRICPTKLNLFPQAHETLSYLEQRYCLHLISNGFKESTELKLATTGLGGYFKNIIISEMVGVNKPDKAIFEFALNQAEASKDECIMVGDSLEADIRGAQNFGMEAIYFNPLNKAKPKEVTRQIRSLDELINLL